MFWCCTHREFVISPLCLSVHPRTDFSFCSATPSLLSNEFTSDPVLYENSIGLVFSTRLLYFYSRSQFFPTFFFTSDPKKKKRRIKSEKTIGNCSVYRTRLHLIWADTYTKLDWFRFVISLGTEWLFTKLVNHFSASTHTFELSCLRHSTDKWTLTHRTIPSLPFWRLFCLHFFLPFVCVFFFQFLFSTSVMRSANLWIIDAAIGTNF